MNLKNEIKNGEVFENFKSNYDSKTSKEWTEIDKIPKSSPQYIVDNQICGVVKRFIDLELSQADNMNIYEHDDFIDFIPSDFDINDTYNIIIKNQNDEVVNYQDYNYVLDNIKGTITFTDDIPSDMPPKISFYKYVGEKGFVYNSGTSIYYISPNGNDITGDGSISNPYYSFHQILNNLPCYTYEKNNIIIYFQPGSYDFSNLGNVLIANEFNIDNYESISIIPNTSTYANWFTTAISSGTFSSMDTGQTIHYNSSVTYNTNDLVGKFIYAKSFYGTTTSPTQHYTSGGQCLSNKHIPILLNTTNSIETSYITSTSGNDGIFGFQNIKDYDIVDLATTFYFGKNMFKIKDINRCTFYITAAILKFDSNDYGYSIDATPDPLKINNTNGFLYNCKIITKNYINSPMLSYRNCSINLSNNVIEPKNVIGCSILCDLNLNENGRVVYYDNFSNNNYLFNFNNIGTLNSTSIKIGGLFLAKQHGLSVRRNKFSGLYYAIRLSNVNGNRSVNMMNEHVINNVEFFFYVSQMTTIYPFIGLIFDNYSRPFTLLGTPKISNWTVDGVYAYNGKLTDVSNGRFINVLTNNFEGRSSIPQYNTNTFYRSGETVITDDVIFNNIKDITTGEAFNYSKWKPVNNQLTVSTTNRNLLTNNIKSGATVYDLSLGIQFRKNFNSWIPEYFNNINVKYLKITGITNSDVSGFTTITQNVNNILTIYCKIIDDNTEILSNYNVKKIGNDVVLYNKLLDDYDITNKLYLITIVYEYEYEYE